MSLFLTSSELLELTGYKLASKQSSWLENHGYYMEINARGIPRITYSQVEEMRRNHTPANLLILKHTPRPLTNRLNPDPTMQSIASLEPNLNNLRLRIQKASVNG
jgi:Domain of unknown function (DUF4224)